MEDELDENGFYCNCSSKYQGKHCQGTCRQLIIFSKKLAFKEIKQGNPAVRLSGISV